MAKRNLRDTPHDTTVTHFDHDAVGGGRSGNPCSVMLSFSAIGRNYEVKQIVNSTAYKPGDWLSIDVTTQLCALPNWTVTMIEPDYLSLISRFIP